MSIFQSGSWTHDSLCNTIVITSSEDSPHYLGFYDLVRTMDLNGKNVPLLHITQHTKFGRLWGLLEVMSLCGFANQLGCDGRYRNNIQNSVKLPGLGQTNDNEYLSIPFVPWSILTTCKIRSLSILKGKLKTIWTL